MANEFPLALVVKAVDKATGPIRAMAAKLNALTAPARKLGKDLGALSDAAGLPRLASGVGGVGSALRSVGGEALALAARLAGVAAAAGFAFYHVVRGAVDSGDKLSEMADRVGMSVDAFASLQYAAAQADVEQEAFNSAIDQFNKRLGEAKAGGGPLLSFLQKVSPRLAEQVKSAKNSEAALSLMTDAFARVKDPAKRAALAAEAFGKSGLQMGTFLAQGSAAIQKQQSEFIKLAGSQEAFARVSGEVDNALRDTETAFSGLRTAAMAGLLPAVLKITRAVTDFVAKNRDGLQRWAENTGKAISDWVDGGGIERVASALKVFAGTVVSVIDMVGGLRNVVISVGLVMAGPLLGSIVSVVPAVYSLGAALLATPVGWFLLAVAAIASAVFLIYKNWAPISQFFKDTLGPVVDIVAGLSTSINGLLTLDVDKMFSGWTRAADGFRSVLAQMQDIWAFASGNEGMAIAADQERNRKFFAANAAPLNASAARAIPIQSQSTDAKVSVNFSNMPPGARVSVDPTSTQSVDLSTGYSMGAP